MSPLSFETFSGLKKIISLKHLWHSAKNTNGIWIRYKLCPKLVLFVLPQFSILRCFEEKTKKTLQLFVGKNLPTRLATVEDYS